MALSGWLSIAAIVLSGGSLIVAILALRQSARLRAQPKLVPRWAESIEPHNGLFVRFMTLYNYGDATASDIQVFVRYAAQAPWVSYDTIDPGGSERIAVPLVDGMTWRPGVQAATYQREGRDEPYKLVTPTVTVKWRQAPYGGRHKQLRRKAPKTPQLLPKVS